MVAQLRPISRMSVKDLCDAFVAGAKSTVSVAIACACVGIIVGVCAQLVWPARELAMSLKNWPMPHLFITSPKMMNSTIKVAD